MTSPSESFILWSRRWYQLGKITTLLAFSLWRHIQNFSHFCRYRIHFIPIYPTLLILMHHKLLEKILNGSFIVKIIIHYYYLHRQWAKTLEKKRSERKTSLLET